MSKIPHRPIKVMHVVGYLGLAGTEYGVIKLVNRLNRDYFSPMVTCMHFQVDMTKTILDKKIPVFELQRNSGVDFRTVLRLASLLRNERIDLVHSHNWTTFFYTVIAAKIARVPIIIHGEHGHEETNVRRKQLLMSRWLAKGIKKLVVVSGDLREEILKRWKVKPDLVSVIPNGVDLLRFAEDYSLDALRKEFRLRPDQKVIVSIGHLRPIKDHQTLLRAFGKVFPKLSNLRMLLVGSDYPKGNRERLEGLAEDVGIRDVIHFTGARNDIPQLLALCNVYVNTSLFEGMSNTILEAMAAKKPVIATRVGGNPELVEDGVTGYLIPAKSEQKLAERLVQLLSDDALSRKMGEAGRAKVESHHSMSEMVESYSNLYRETFCRYQLKRKQVLREQGKQWAGRVLQWSGLNHLKRSVQPPRLTILTYHRVLPLHEALFYPYQTMVMPRDLFEAQMAYLSRNFAVLELPESMRLLKEGRLPRRAVAITFDDGYRDNYEHAWPILKKYGIPATFFLVAGALDNKMVLWWDRVGEVVKELSTRQNFNSQNEVRTPEWMSALLKELYNGSASQTIARRLVQRMNSLPREKRQESFDALIALSDYPSNGESDLMLTWDQVKELENSGMQIGAHTITHAFLDELNEEVARKEIEGSIKALERQLQIPICFFSYPRGRMDERVKPILKKSGVKAAVTTKPGSNPYGTDLLELKRIDAGYFLQNRGFDPSTFEAELQGWFSLLRGK